MSSVTEEFVEQIEPLEGEEIEEGTMVRHIFDDESCGTVIKRETHVADVLWSRKPTSLRYSNIARIRHMLKKYTGAPVADVSTTHSGSTLIVRASLKESVSIDRIEVDVKV